MRPTLKDVAKLANVNFTLVSKYINRNPQARMTEETRKRIEAAIRQLNYRPSASARTLRSGRSKIIGLLSHDLTNAYSAHIADLTLRELDGRGYQMLIALARDEGGHEALRTLLTREVDGVIAPTLPGETLPCPAAAFPAPDLDRAMEDALRGVSGRITGLFFEPFFWPGTFSAACLKYGLEYEKFLLSFDRNARLKEIRNACVFRPDFIITSGWETLTMLLELLDDEFPGYEPRLLVYANCTGPFLGDRRLAGAIYSSSTAMVRKTCGLLLDRIENPDADNAEQRIPAHYIPAGTPEYDALVSRHFRLT